MKLERSVSHLLLLSLAMCLAALVAGCRSQPKAISPDLGAAESFQRAQDASDAGNYALAIRYYSAYRESHPDNKDRDIWALYEIAFNYHKMGNTAKAIELLDELLKQYQTDGDTLPPAPRILAQELRGSWSQKSR
ncbi:MAG TPA: tetratricopeptide repeat protein [Spirochaetia bacterium]|nr:tetratricopeptide repeat protein [Spirochaetia bacterium]